MSKDIVTNLENFDFDNFKSKLSLDNISKLDLKYEDFYNGHTLISIKLKCSENESWLLSSHGKKLLLTVFDFEHFTHTDIVYDISDEQYSILMEKVFRFLHKKVY